MKKKIDVSDDVSDQERPLKPNMLILSLIWVLFLYALDFEMNRLQQCKLSETE